MSDLPLDSSDAIRAVVHPAASLAAELGERLADAGWTMTTAESCTGGLIAAAITDISGSSAWFGHGFVTYANAAKSAMLEVSANDLQNHGAVSEVVVKAMVEGACTAAAADVGVAVSGVAGPGGGSADKPVGTVWLSWRVPGLGTDARCCHFSGDRRQVREAAVTEALRGTIARIIQAGARTR